tara:strand:+ start:726 stop:956 length:231 start_codon:yes stop_codon:yes gene_type:complete
MSRSFRIDGVEYDADELSAEGSALVDRLMFVQRQTVELFNEQAVLNKAKNAYIADLKAEIVEGRTGVDLGVLFSDD